VVGLFYKVWKICFGGIIGNGMVSGSNLTWATVKKKKILRRIKCHWNNTETDGSQLERSVDGYEKGLSLSGDFAGVGTSNFSLDLRLWTFRAFQNLVIEEMVMETWKDWSGLAFWEYKDGKLWMEFIPLLPVVMLFCFHSPSTALSMTVL
jgi:hypothetical protein